MNFETARAHVVASLEQGADLRIKVGKDCAPTIVEAASIITSCLRSGGKLLFFGNGGSAR